MGSVVKRYIIGICLGLILATCVEPFEIESIGLEDLLVVEAFLSDEQKEHRVVLTRTAEIDQFNFSPETGATIRIVEEGGPTVLLIESEEGIYLTPSDFGGTVGSNYSLEIQTTDGGEYASTWVSLKSTPRIDSIYGRFVPTGSERGRRGIQFLLDTHDPGSQTHFYRWDWEETFEIRTPLNSKFDWIEGNLVLRREIPVDRCFASSSSADILIKSTEALQSDIVTEFPLNFVPGGRGDIKVKYSLLVRQYSLSKDAFLFWEGLRVQNETQGSLFDVQPASVIGNIRSLTDENEVVLGFFDASQVSTARRFFTPEDFISQGFIPPGDNVNCQLDTVAINEIGVYMQSLINSPTPREIYDVAIDQFLVAPRFCTDCSDRGDVNIPDFWE